MKLTESMIKKMILEELGMQRDDVGDEQLHKPLRELIEKIYNYQLGLVGDEAQAKSSVIDLVQKTLEYL